MARYSAVLDACVLVPIDLTQVLLGFADADLYRPVWSSTILHEARSAVLGLPNKDPVKIARRFHRMDQAFPGACAQNLDAFLNAVALPDEDDRHVVAAALASKADAIVTSNVKDFPPDVLRPFELEVQSPDTFLTNQLTLHPAAAVSALYAFSLATNNPHITVESILDRLAQLGCRGFAAAAVKELWRHPNPGT